MASLNKKKGKNYEALNQINAEDHMNKDPCFFLWKFQIVMNLLCNL